MSEHIEQRQGYDKNKSHQAATVLNADQMNIVYDRRKNLGIKTTSEYIRRLILQDISNPATPTLIDFKALEEQIVELKSKLKDVEAEERFSHGRAVENAKKVRTLEIQIKEKSDNLASLHPSRDYWMNAFICLENSILERGDNFGSINVHKPKYPPYIDEKRIKRLINRVDELVNLKLLKEEFERQLTKAQEEVTRQVIIIGKLEDTVNTCEPHKIFDIDLAPERREKLIESVRTYRSSLMSGKTAEAHIRRPGFKFAMKMLWRSIFG